MATCKEKKSHPRGYINGRQTPEYQAWANMIRRCYSKQHPSYPNYGGRGISVCPEWRASYAAFYASVGARPSPNHSLDRIDNEDGYKPSNCKWSTLQEQSRNKRTTVFVCSDGKVMTLAEWAEHLGLPYNVVRLRWLREWPVERILGTPIRTRRPRRKPQTTTP